jgi:hypothetical protein
MQAEKIINKGVEVIPISPNQVEEIWGLVHFMIAESIQYSGNYANANDIKELLLTGENQLFLIFGSEDGVDNKVFGLCTTRIFNNPNFYRTTRPYLYWEEDGIMGRKTSAYIRNFC